LKSPDDRARTNDCRTHASWRRSLVYAILAAVVVGGLEFVVLLAIHNQIVHRDRQRLDAGSELLTLSTALDMYRLDVGAYPDNISGLASNDATVGWDGPYMPVRHIPPIDGWGNRFEYRLLAPCRYELRSAGPDGIFRTTDDLVLVTPKA
jgi:general secretion pathway protein G